MGSAAPLRLACAALVGALPLLALLLPRRAALFAPLAVLALALAATAAERVLGGLAAWSFAYPLGVALLAATAPRAVALASAGARPWPPAAAGGTVLALLVLPSLGSMLLGLVWYQEPTAVRDWEVVLDPTEAGPFVARVPLPVTDDAATARVLDAILADARVVSGSATLERDGDGLLVRGAGGPVRIEAEHRYLGHGRLEARAPDASAWRFEGEGGLVASWRYTPGCGEGVVARVQLGEVPPPAPTPVPVTASTPAGPPCIHGD